MTWWRKIRNLDKVQKLTSELSKEQKRSKGDRAIFYYDTFPKTVEKDIQDFAYSTINNHKVFINYLKTRVVSLKNDIASPEKLKSEKRFEFYGRLQETRDLLNTIEKLTR